MLNTMRLIGFAVALAPFFWTPFLQAEDSQPFSVVLLPDTQLYSRDHPEIYMSQTEWIKKSAEAEIEVRVYSPVLERHREGGEYAYSLSFAMTKASPPREKNGSLVPAGR